MYKKAVIFTLAILCVTQMAFAIDVKKIPATSAKAVGASLNESTEDFYEFPVYQKLKDRDGKEVEVVVNVQRVRKSDLLRQKGVIDAMIKGTEDADKAEVKPVEEPAEG